MGSTNLVVLMMLITVLFCISILGSADATRSGFYVDNGVDQTIMHRLLTRREKKEMQQEILHLLGLHARPRPDVHGVNYSAPQFLLDIYESVRSDDEFLPKSKAKGGFNFSASDLLAIRGSDLIMSFVNHEKHIGNLRHGRGSILWFDVSEISVGQKIVTAQVRLYKQKMDHLKKISGDITITLYQLLDEPLWDNRLLYSDSVDTSYDFEGWLQLNVTRPLISWITFPSSNLGIYISVKSSDNELRASEVGLVTSKEEIEKQPFMVGFFKSPEHHEIKIRNARGTRRKKKSFATDLSREPWYKPSDPLLQTFRSCHRRNLYVNFKDLNFQDWIIAPQSYTAYYCAGECSFPLNAQANATHHAIIQTLVNLVNPTKAPQAKCAPTELSPVMVLYYTSDNEVVLKQFSNMIVRSCGCH